MKIFVQQLITGTSIGGLYALLAVGYALIYSIFDFTNFAFGSLMMMGAFMTLFVVSFLHLPILLVLAIVIVFSMLLSLSVELVAYRPLRNKKASRLFLMIAAMGVDIFLVNIMVVLFSGNQRSIPYKFPITSIQLGPFVIGFIDLMAIVTSFIILIALWVYLQKTKNGIAIRASAVDGAAAGLMGVNVNTISVIVFFISGFAAGVAGFFFGFKYSVYPTMNGLATKAFIASVVGGLGSLPGAVLGGVLLGILETLVSGYISSTFRDLFSFGLLVIILLFMPNGLLGKNMKQKS